MRVALAVAFIVVVFLASDVVSVVVDVLDAGIVAVHRVAAVVIAPV